MFQSNLYLSRGYDTSTYALTSSSSPQSQSRHSPAVKYFGIARRFTDGIRNALWHSTPHFLSSLNNSTMPNTRCSLPKKMDSENASAFSGRLEDSQVRKIFACVKEGRVPTEDIAFNIIKMTDKKPMLSPPSFEFEGECMHALSSLITLCVIQSYLPLGHNLMDISSLESSATKPTLSFLFI